MSNRHRGFTLIEIVVVILVLAILIAMAAALTRGVAAGQKRALTVTRLQTVDAALVQFVMQQKRLPCPADGRLLSSDAAAGGEGARDANGACSPVSQQHGVVPWRLLGLSEQDATDGWDRRLTYRTDPELARANRMNMSGCDPAGSKAMGAAPNFCDTTCVSTDMTLCTSPSNFLANRGLIVRDASGDLTRPALMDPAAAAHSGAAYVLISHGESGGGGYLSSGQLGTSSVGDGTQEQRNWASTLHSATYWYVDDALNETTTTAHFDDIVVRPSVLGVITKAGLGPRAH